MQPSTCLGLRIDHFDYQPSALNLHTHLRTDRKAGTIEPTTL
ncbi:MAG: hypothetical protein WBF89_10065 [Steroidobacteraceae bacterium]